MPTDLTYHPKPPADLIRGDTCDSRRFMSPHSRISPVCATVVGCWSVVPAGTWYSGMPLFCRALLSAGAGDASVHTTANYSPPFRPTPNHPWSRQATSVWPNLDQHPRSNGTYIFSAKERDPETGYSYFGSRYYSSDLSIWLSVDPMSDKYPSLSPYVYCADNPVRLVDPNGNFPIIPFLIKAGINAMADCLMQAAMNYYFNPQTAGDLRASFLNINGWITLKSGAEGVIPWKIPGGKAGRAAVTAAGDVLAYFCASPKQYTTKQALEDFTVGFIGELAGGGLSDLIAKYGAPAVAKGLCRIPGFSVNKIRGLTGYTLSPIMHKI